MTKLGHGGPHGMVLYGMVRILAFVLFQEFIENLHELHEEWLLGPQSARLPAPVVVSRSVGL